MKSTQTLGILFFIRKERASNENQAAIYLRITINGKRAELSIRREIEIKRWNSKGGCAIGTSEASRQMNEYINLWEAKVYKSHKELVESGVVITADAIKNKLIGKSEKQKTLVEVFEYHNRMLADKVGIDHA